MNCVHCGKPNPSAPTILRRKRRDKGLCINCAKPLTDAEKAKRPKPNIRCEDCRGDEAGRARAKRDA